MKSIFDGFVKTIFTLLALGAGFVLVLKFFLNPPKAATSSVNPVSKSTQIVPPPTTPPITNKPALNNNPQTQPVKSNETNLANNPQPKLKTEPEESTATAIEQPIESVLEIPRNLERGANLKLYVNLDEDDSQPNPLNHSPREITKTNKIALASTAEKDNFQSALGYFKVSKSGEYNFLLEGDERDRRYLKNATIKLRIDNEALDHNLGGRVSLEKGWHKIELYYYPRTYARKIDETQIEVKMGNPGEIAKSLEVWREVEK